jgi:hypothetical protein
MGGASSAPRETEEQRMKRLETTKFNFQMKARKLEAEAKNIDRERKGCDEKIKKFLREGNQELVLASIKDALRRKKMSTNMYKMSMKMVQMSDRM